MRVGSWAKGVDSLLRPALILLFSLADDPDKSMSGVLTFDDSMSDDSMSDDPVSDDPVSGTFWGTQIAAWHLLWERGPLSGIPSGMRIAVSDLILWHGLSATCREIVGPASFVQMKATWDGCAEPSGRRRARMPPRVDHPRGPRRRGHIPAIERPYIYGVARFSNLTFHIFTVETLPK